MSDAVFDDALCRVQSALLVLKRELAAQRLLHAAHCVGHLLRKAGFNPDQPRDDGGRWTEIGTDEEGASREDDPEIILVGGPGGRSGYPVDILEEDALGGHTYERHVGKSEVFLKARVIGSRTNVAEIFTFGLRRAGSFTSLAAANKLANSTISQKGEKVEAFVARRFPHSLPVTYLFAEFDRPTGYEAYAPNDRAQPIIRSTYGVTVRLVRTDRSTKSYFVHSAWPTNRD